MAYTRALRSITESSGAELQDFSQQVHAQLERGLVRRQPYLRLLSCFGHRSGQTLTVTQIFDRSEVGLGHVEAFSRDVPDCISVVCTHIDTLWKPKDANYTAARGSMCDQAADLQLQCTPGVRTVNSAKGSLDALVQQCKCLGNQAFRRHSYAGTRDLYRLASTGLHVFSSVLCLLGSLVALTSVIEPFRRVAEAIKFYTEAIAGASHDASLFSNRSAAHAACYMYPEALKDAAIAIRLNPAWPKAHYR